MTTMYLMKLKSEFSRYCVLSGGNQCRALSRYQREEIQLLKTGNLTHTRSVYSRTLVFLRDDDLKFKFIVN